MIQSPGANSRMLVSMPIMLASPVEKTCSGESPASTSNSSFTVTGFSPVSITGVKM